MNKLFAENCKLSDPNLGVGIRYLGNNEFSIQHYNTKFRGWYADIYKVNNPDTERLIKKYFDRYLYPYLDSGEMRVLMFILDRTIGWGKLSEDIRKVHFYNGIKGYTGGCGLSRSGVEKALDSLHLKGFIKSIDKRYWLDFNAINQWTINEGIGIVSLKDPKNKTEKVKGLKSKKEKIVHSVDSDDYQECTHSTHHNDPKSDLNDPTLLERIPQAELTPQTLLNKEDRIQHRVVERRSKIVNQRSEVNLEDRPIVLNSTAIFKRWVSMMRDCFPHTLVHQWSIKEKGMVKKFIKTLDLPEGVTIFDFFDFVVSDWHVINERHFAFWNKHLIEKGQPAILYPEIPSIHFVLKFRKGFLNAYQKFRLNELDESTMLRRQLRSRGYTDEMINNYLEQKLLDEQKAKGLSERLEREIKRTENTRKQLDRDRNQYIDRAIEKGIKRDSDVESLQTIANMPKMDDMAVPARVIKKPSGTITTPYIIKPEIDEATARKIAKNWVVEGVKTFDLETIYQTILTLGVEQARFVIVGQ